MSEVEVKFKKLVADAVLPTYAHDGDSGMDIRAAETFSIGHDGCRHTFSTGLAAEIPEGYELQVRPRSGLAHKHGVFCMWGTVDCGYRGEIGVTLVNLGHEGYLVHKGDKIAQLVLAPVTRATIKEVETIDSFGSDRGANGFGSTGK